MTEIKIEQLEFSFTCNEIGFETCDVANIRKMTYSKSWEAKQDQTVGGSLPPPPCQAAQGVLPIMFLYLAMKNNLTGNGLLTSDIYKLNIRIKFLY